MVNHSPKRYVTTTVLILISFLIISSSALMTESSDISADEVPTWVEGDNWSYRSNESYRVQNYTAEMVSEREHIDIDETIFDCYMINYTIDDFVETHFYTIDGLSLVAEMSDEGTFAYNPTLKRFEFPLDVGTTWDSATIIWREPEDGGTWEKQQEWELEFKVEEITTVEVPAGTFDTYVINITQYEGMGEFVEYYYYSPEVKNMVKREEYLYGNLQLTEELTDYELMEREDDDDDIPFLNTGIIILTMAASAVIYSFHYKKKGKGHQ